MDGSRFDQLARSFSLIGTRRGLVRVLVTLPGVAGLLALAGAEPVAVGRRRRKHKRKGKHKKKRCRPQPLAETCAEKCGTVKNNCKKSVDCGPCDCGACPICQTCDAATRECVPDAGQPTCADGGRCCGGVCCESSQVCDADDACCTPLTEAAACAAAQANGQQCGAASDGCGGSYDCGGCPNGVCQSCNAQGTCVAANGGVRCDAGNPCSTDDTCHDGACIPGRSICEHVVCKGPGICDPATVQCTYANEADGTPCPDGGNCCGGVCITATTCLPAGGLCGHDAFDEPPCACGCCSGEWAGPADFGICI